jgi:hypothetical protein
MRSGIALVMTFAAMVAAGSSVAQAQGMGAMKMETIEGVLVDTKCYGMMPEQNAGQNHMVEMGGNMTTVPNCATACANLGIPAGLKQGTATTIVLAAPAGQLAKHMAEQVKLEGVYSKDKATFIVMRVIPANGEPYDITSMM